MQAVLDLPALQDLQVLLAPLFLDLLDTTACKVRLVLLVLMVLVGPVQLVLQVLQVLQEPGVALETQVQLDPQEKDPPVLLVLLVLLVDLENALSFRTLRVLTVGRNPQRLTLPVLKVTRELLAVLSV